MLIEQKRSRASVNVYLVLCRGDEVLLHLRANTGYGDGQYGLIAGHVEDGESATNAVIREAYEEAGIVLEPSCLNVIHVMHRQSDRCNVDLFFSCTHWQGLPTNREPEKCAALEYFSLAQLPDNTLGYIRDVVQAMGSGNLYSEYGWNSNA